MNVSPMSLLVGVSSFVPGVPSLTARRTGGSCSARYCYGIWMRHLLHLHANGLPTRFAVMAELGPGDSLGVGLAALLTGADRYVGLDRTAYAETGRNLAVFDALVEMLHERAAIPDDHELPGVFPRLPHYRFPGDILTAARLDAMLEPARVARLRDALGAPAPSPAPGAPIAYVVPWGPDALPAGSVDLILSHAVLHLGDDLPDLYRTMNAWLRPGGAMSHELDFKSIGRTRTWNGHWTCSDLTWTLLQGRRRNQMNRIPASVHRAIQRDLGLDILGDATDARRSTIARAELAPRFAGLTDADLITASALIQSRKPARAEPLERGVQGAA